MAVDVPLVCRVYVGVVSTEEKVKMSSLVDKLTFGNEGTTS